MNDSNLNISDKMTDFVNKLSLVRDDYIATKNELHNSIRKDIVKVELKDAINSTQDYTTLKNAIEKLIETW